MSTKLLWWKWLQRSTIIITRTVSTHTKHTFILNIKLLEIKGQKQKIIQRKMASHAMLLRLNPDAMRENNPTPTPRETGVEWTVFTYKNLIGSYIWWCNNISCNVFNTSSYVGMGFSAELVSLQWSFSDFEQSSLLNEYHWMDIIITLFSVFFLCVCFFKILFLPLFNHCLTIALYFFYNDLLLFREKHMQPWILPWTCYRKKKKENKNLEV